MNVCPVCIHIKQINPEIMNDHRPVSFVHACALLNQYCQLEWASQSIDGMNRLWCNVRVNILELNNALQGKDKERVKNNDIRHMHALPYNFVLVFEDHGKKYNIMHVILYITLHLEEQTAEFWDEKNDINMSDYNPLESPRASSRAGGRETPTKLSHLLAELKAVFMGML